MKQKQNKESKEKRQFHTLKAKLKVGQTPNRAKSRLETRLTPWEPCLVTIRLKLQLAAEVGLKVPLKSTSSLGLSLTASGRFHRGSDSLLRVRNNPQSLRLLAENYSYFRFLQTLLALFKHWRGGRRGEEEGGSLSQNTHRVIAHLSSLHLER